MSVVAAALGLVEWLHVAAAMLLFGGEAFLAFLVPDGLAIRLARERRRLVGPAAALLGLTGFAWILFQAGLMAGDPAAMTDPATLATVLTGTAFGQAWLVHLGLVAILAGALVAQARCPVTAVLAGLALATIGLVGHATIHAGLLGLAHRANLILHLLSAGAWLGALVPLLGVMRCLAEPAQRSDAVVALRRFSSIGHGVVALVLVTGALNTVLVLGALLPDATSPYGRLLLGKVALVAAMVWIAVWNRYVLVPNLRATPAAAGSLHRLTALNVTIGGAVLLVSVVLGMTDPLPA